MPQTCDEKVTITDRRANGKRSATISGDRGPCHHRPQVAVVVPVARDLAEPGGLQQWDHELVLVTAELHVQRPTRADHVTCPGDDPPDDVEPVGTSVERRTRLVAERVGRQEAQSPGGHVGGHRGHDVEGPDGPEGLAEVVDHDDDAIPPGASGGDPVALDADHRRRRNGVLEVHGHAAGSRA